MNKRVRKREGYQFAFSRGLNVSSTVAFKFGSGKEKPLKFRNWKRKELLIYIFKLPKNVSSTIALKIWVTWMVYDIDILQRKLILWKTSEGGFEIYLLIIFRY